MRVRVRVRVRVGVRVRVRVRVCGLPDYVLPQTGRTGDGNASVIITRQQKSVHTLKSTWHRTAAATCSVETEVYGSKDFSLSRPLLTTHTMSSIVMAVSAMLVASTICGTLVVVGQAHQTPGSYSRGHCCASTQDRGCS